MAADSLPSRHLVSRDHVGRVIERNQPPGVLVFLQEVRPQHEERPIGLFSDLIARRHDRTLPDAERLDTRNVLETNIHRIRSIASVHEVLSERGFRLVDVRDVIQRISQTMATTMVQPDKSIQIHIIGDPLQLPSKEATALTLVVNELLQNSLEHAFTGRQAGVIEVIFIHSADGITVFVRDDGIGMVDGYQPNLGLEIAETLVEDDLNGRLSFHDLNPGTEVRVHLPPPQN